MNSIKLRFKFTPAGARSTLTGKRIYIGISLSESFDTQELILRRLTQWASTTNVVVSFVVGDFFFQRNLEVLDGISHSAACKTAMTVSRKFAGAIGEESKKLGLEPNIQFASQLCQGSDFGTRVERLLALFKDDIAFRRRVDAGAARFLKSRSEWKTNAATALKHSQMYQIQEIAMFEALAAAGWTVNAYWGSHLPIMIDLVDGELRGLSPDLSKLTLIAISRRS